MAYCCSSSAFIDFFLAAICPQAPAGPPLLEPYIRQLMAFPGPLGPTTAKDKVRCYTPIAWNSPVGCIATPVRHWLWVGPARTVLNAAFLHPPAPTAAQVAGRQGRGLRAPAAAAAAGGRCLPDASLRRAFAAAPAVGGAAAAGQARGQRGQGGQGQAGRAEPMIGWGWVGTPGASYCDIQCCHCRRRAACPQGVLLNVDKPDSLLSS